MRYLSVTEIAKKWDISERSVRNYCAHGRVRSRKQVSIPVAFTIRHRLI